MYRGLHVYGFLSAFTYMSSNAVYVSNALTNERAIMYIYVLSYTHIDRCVVVFHYGIVVVLTLILYAVVLFSLFFNL